MTARLEKVTVSQNQLDFEFFEECTGSGKEGSVILFSMLFASGTVLEFQSTGGGSVSTGVYFMFHPIFPDKER